MLIIPSYREVGKDFIENCKENLEEHIKANIEFNKKIITHSDKNMYQQSKKLYTVDV